MPFMDHFKMHNKLYIRLYNIGTVHYKHFYDDIIFVAFL